MVELSGECGQAENRVLSWRKQAGEKPGAIVAAAGRGGGMKEMRQRWREVGFVPLSNLDFLEWGW
jgi:hypothetical protein